MDEKTLISLIQNEGAKFYDTQIVNENSHNIYRVFITCEGGVNLDLCAKISNIISPLLDLNPPMQGKYLLEVSSPGLERKLSKTSHFLNSIGEIVKIKLQNSEKIIAKLVNADEKGIFLLCDDEEVYYLYDDINTARTYIQW